MKKALLLTALALTIVASMVSGTLAVYSQELTPYNTNVIAKEFILLSEGTQGFSADVLIAPTETVTLAFTVQNYNTSATSEVPIDIEVEVVFSAATGRDAIEPLTATIDGGSSGSSITGTLTDGVGTFTITDALLANTEDLLTFEIEIEWPSDEDIDLNFAGAGFGTNVAITVSGKQAVL